MCSCGGREPKPGYGSYLPGSYQLVGPREDQALSVVLAVAAAGATTNNPSIPFHVRTPNVRVRTRVVVVYEPIGSSVDVDSALYTAALASAGSLWVALKTGTRSNRTKNPPTRDIVGTGASPLAVPTNTRLWGYDFEVETNGEELLGVFVPPDCAAGNPGGQWTLAVFYESVERLSKEEWNQFVQGYGIEPLAPVALT
jgi:hypothetical protein